MKLNTIQKEQIRRQIEAYEKQKGTEIVRIPFGVSNLKLEIDKYVASPNIMNSGVQMVRYLLEHPYLVKDKVVTDMGTGSGIIGVASAKLGAKKVYMLDIDERAVRNAKRNVIANNLEKTCYVFQSDLFSKYPKRKKSEVQIFNHPYFAVSPVKDKKWTQIMLGRIGLIIKYLKQAPKYSTLDAIYIFSWLTLCGNENTNDNDPGKIAPKQGYKFLKVTEQAPVAQGIQQGKFKIYEFRR